MAVEQAQEFLYDEAGYLSWIGTHPSGFVLHTERTRNPYYMILHRATCPLVSRYTDRLRPGGFTERDYIKVCSAGLFALQTWVKGHGRPDGSFSSLCSVCNPGDG